jgi:hypothetical protein
MAYYIMTLQQYLLLYDDEEFKNDLLILVEKIKVFNKKSVLPLCLCDGPIKIVF